MQAPAEAVLVVGCAFGWVGKDLVGGYDEVVPLETHFWGDAPAERVVVAGPIRVVYLDEVVEVAFGIWGARFLLE